MLPDQKRFTSGILKGIKEKKQFFSPKGLMTLLQTHKAGYC